MPRRRIVGKRNYPFRRVAYRMSNGRDFYEKQPRKFPYGVIPYFQNFYIAEGYVADG
jgi:hypothetical protein